MALKKEALLIPFAKIYFMVTGYVFQMVIARLLTKSMVGMFNYVNTVISPINMILVQGGVQSSSHFISRVQHQESYERIKYRVMRIFLSIALVLFLFMQFLAPYVSKVITKDVENSMYYRIGVIIVVFYAVYAVLIGVFNGQKRFKVQALFDMTYSTIKVSFIALALFLGFELYGLLIGWVLATVVITVLSFLYSIRQHAKGEKHTENKNSEQNKKDKPVEAEQVEQVKLEDDISSKDILKYAVPIIASQFLFYLLLNIDTWILGILSSKEEVLIHGGNYLTVTTLARIPYQIVISITFIIFPFISKLSMVKAEELKSYIRNSLRYSILIAAPFVVLISVYPSIFLKIIYGDAFVENAPYLQVLVLGILFLALFMINITIITASGKPLVSMFITGAVIPVSILLNVHLIQDYSLYGAVIATSTSFFIAWMMASVYLFRRFKAIPPFSTLLRLAGIYGVYSLIFQYLQPSNVILGLLLLMLGGVGIYVLFILSFEFKKEDVNTMRAMFQRKKKSS